MENIAVAKDEHEDIGDYHDGVGNSGGVCQDYDVVDDPENTGNNPADCGECFVSCEREAVNHATEDW